jgi:aspartyl-tRNA(Asn)/glutamyl-tRNA(Gln) amidotransferase subunit C
MADKDDKIITDDLVRHVSKLARLSLDDESVHKFRDQLAQILAYIAQLSEVDTQGTQPTSHVLSSMKNVFREDAVKASLSADEALINAPARDEDFFKVPKII